jgi:nucleotide-binding universal stress UspA family protein
VFRHLLVPLDGSPPAEAALPLAVGLARRLGASVTLLHVIERGAPAAVHGERHLSDPGEAGRYLEGLARGEGAAPRVACHVHTDLEADVAGSIARRAEELEADLIVMCTHGRRQLRHRLFGSVAQGVLGRGRIPVLLAPPGRGRETWVCRRVLAPVDARPEHGHSLPVALAFARACGAAVHVLWVVPTLGTLSGEHAATGHLLPGTTAALLELEEEQAGRWVRAETERAGAEGIPVTLEVARGDPAETILEAATRADADLLVVGTHARPGMDAFLAGSVAPRVAGRAMWPLLLVPLHQR